MSSLRLADRLDAELAVDADQSWTAIASPLASQAQPHAPGVVLSLAVARERYRRGLASGVTVDLDALGPYGSGDAALANAIERDIETRWDD